MSKTKEEVKNVFVKRKAEGVPKKDYLKFYLRISRAMKMLSIVRIPLRAKAT